MKPLIYVGLAVLFWALVPPLFLILRDLLKKMGREWFFARGGWKIVLANVLVVSVLTIAIAALTRILSSKGDRLENHQSAAAMNVDKAEIPGTGEVDEIVFWTWEEYGTPQEAFLVEAVRLWNESHPTVQVRHENQPYSGYANKLRLALAAGNPPDIAVGGIGDLENLAREGEMPELSVPIPGEFFSAEEREKYGPMVMESITRQGKLWIFPLFRYLYGGFMSVNKKMLHEAGYDENKLLEQGWTIAEFREACRKMTKDLDGDGKVDVYGFGTPLKNLRELFENEFGASYWGVNKTERWQFTFITFNKSSQRWERDPELKVEDFLGPMQVIHDLIYVDQTFGRKYFGMVHHQITQELIDKQSLAMTWSGAPQVYVQNARLYNLELKEGTKQGNPVEIVVIQTPKFEKGGHAVFSTGVAGYVVFKQKPYKGEAHTRNALLFARYISSPIMVSYFQYRTRGAFPPPSKRTLEIFPGIVDFTQPEWRPYKLFFDSPFSWAPAKDLVYPRNRDRLNIMRNFLQWKEQRGYPLLEAIALKQISPREAATRWYEAVAQTVNSYYASKKLP